MSEPEQSGPRVEVWEEAPGAWRWRYVVGEPGSDDGEGLELASTIPEPSRDAAVAAAELAYPGLPVRVQTGALTRARLAATPRSRLWWAWPAATAAVAVSLAAVAARYRRWWVLPLAPLLAHGVVSRLRRSLP